MIIHFSRH